MSVNLTAKQTAFFEAYYNPISDTFGNGVKSAMKAYDTIDYATAGSIAYENLKKPQIKELMESKGIGIDKLLTVLEEGLNAKKIVSAVIVGKDASDKTDDFIEVPDYPTRYKYLEIAGKWANLSPDKVEVKHSGEVDSKINFNVPEEVVDAYIRAIRETATKRRSGVGSTEKKSTDLDSSILPNSQG